MEMTGLRCDSLQGHAGYSGCPGWPIGRVALIAFVRRLAQSGLN